MSHLSNLVGNLDHAIETSTPLSSKIKQPEHRFYDLIYVVRQDISSVDLDRLNSDIMSLMVSYGAEIIKQEYWGIKTMSYVIKRNTKGHYMLICPKISNLNQECLIELERKIKLAPEIIRHIIKRIDKVSENPSPILKSSFAAPENSTAIDASVSAARASGRFQENSRYSGYNSAQREANRANNAQVTTETASPNAIVGTEKEAQEESQKEAQKSSEQENTSNIGVTDHISSDTSNSNEKGDNVSNSNSDDNVSNLSNDSKAELENQNKDQDKDQNKE